MLSAVLEFISKYLLIVFHSSMGPPPHVLFSTRIDHCNHTAMCSDEESITGQFIFIEDWEVTNCCFSHFYWEWWEQSREDTSEFSWWVSVPTRGEVWVLFCRNTIINLCFAIVYVTNCHYPHPHLYVLTLCFSSVCVFQVFMSRHFLYNCSQPVLDVKIAFCQVCVPYR